MDGYGASLAGLLGICVGSFAAVILDRIPQGQSVVAPRSRCSACHRPLSPGELVPVISFLWLRGRCRTCRARIPLRNLGLELCGGLAALGAFYSFGWTAVAVGVVLLIGGTFLAARRWRRRHAQAGYTLVEAVLALGLLAMVLVSYAGLYARNIRIEATARSRLALVNMVRERLDILQGEASAGSLAPDGVWTAWGCANGTDLEWRQKVVTWNGSSTNLYHAIVEVRQHPCGAPVDPAAPPRVERGWAILRHN